MAAQLALCLDCLRPLNLGSLVPDDGDPPGLCPCGARSQTCDCKACLDFLDALTCGDLKSAAGYLLPGVRIIAWSPAEGATFEHPDG